jgi:catechol 1,2-dioxygenase
MPSTRAAALLDRRRFLARLGRFSVGAAGLVVVGCGDGAPELALDAAAGLDAAGCAPTRGDVLGPFHRPGAPSRMTIASATEPGLRLAIGGAILGEDCVSPLAGATIDVWQADAMGGYHEPDAGEPFRLRGVVTTAADGTWMVDTIRPGNYQTAPGAWRPAHIHVIVSAPGYRSLTTQLYFAGDPFLPPNDSCTTCGSDDPARVVALVAGPSGALRGELAMVLARA